MSLYINSGYTVSDNQFMGYAETLPAYQDVLYLLTYRHTDGNIVTLVELIDGKSTGCPHSIINRENVVQQSPWLNRLPDFLAIPLSHLSMMADRRFLLDPFPGDSRMRFIVATAREQLRSGISLALYRPARAFKRKVRRTLRRLHLCMPASIAR